MASQTITDTTDASGTDYVTYAPPNTNCGHCLKPVKSLERVRRVSEDMGSGVPRTMYVHYKPCLK